MAKESEMATWDPLHPLSSCVFSVWGYVQILWSSLQASSILHIGERRGESFNNVNTWIRCRLSSSLTWDPPNAIRGARTYPPTTRPQSFSFIVVEVSLASWLARMSNHLIVFVCSCCMYSCLWLWLTVSIYCYCHFLWGHFLLCPTSAESQ